VWMSARRCRLVVPRPTAGDDMDLGLWSALDLGLAALRAPSRGPFAGLAVAKVPHGCYGIVRARVARDSLLAGPTRRVALDCGACGACCVANRVVLTDEDVERFRTARRGELARPPYARRNKGELVLVLRRDRRCQHLSPNNRCGIYSMRPTACRTFPLASECCLSCREEELGGLEV
jgi:hypothetical protein